MPYLVLCLVQKQQSFYGKCPKILYTKSSDKMAYANSVDPDQTAPSGSILFEIQPKRQELHKKQNLRLKGME